jgi:hypothetical protein
LDGGAKIEKTNTSLKKGPQIVMAPSRTKVIRRKSCLLEKLTLIWMKQDEMYQWD